MAAATSLKQPVDTAPEWPLGAVQVRTSIVARRCEVTSMAGERLAPTIFFSDQV